ncbi:MAG: benzoate/H(+) symporter BenE family transporter [Brevibacterium yomogidense]
MSSQHASEPSSSPDPQSLAQPISAGFVSALVAFTSAFVVVLAGLSAVGASSAQASSGLMAVTILMGVGTVVLAWWSRLPITVAWSTPGAALLVTTGAVEGGWPAALGAFLVTGLLIIVTGLVPPLGDLIARIPTSVAQAMLAGVLLQLCLGPITGAVANPAGVIPVVLVWLVGVRFFPRWAVPAAFVVAAGVVVVHVVTSGAEVDAATIVPRLEFVAPEFTVQAIIGIAVPLYLVTMASQNVPGMAVMKGLGYDVPWRRAMVLTGVGTVIAAPAGGHGINLAAISAALTAGPEAGPDRDRRWIASVTSGFVAIAIGIGAAAFGTLVTLAPEGVIAAVAGLALFGTFASSLKASLEDVDDIIPAVVTFAVVASGIAIGGVSAAFWALLAGLLVRFVLRLGKRRRTNL